MKKSLKTGYSTAFLAPSTRLLNLKLGTSLAPRWLKSSEIELLRQSQQAIAERFSESLARHAHVR